MDCQLECVKPFKPRVHEFTGPVKIVLIEPPSDEYRSKTWGSAFIAFSYMLMAVVTFTLLGYTLNFNDEIPVLAHIALCTVGYQLCIPTGILIMNDMNGPSLMLKYMDKKIEHVCTQTFGLLSCGGGTAIFFLLCEYTEETIVTFHGISGGVALCSGVLCALIGPIVFFASTECTKYMRFLHVFFGEIAFLSSSLCCISGIIRPPINEWYMTTYKLPILLYLTVGFCIGYTLIILYFPTMKICKINEE